jgi:hypothetical protein
MHGVGEGKVSARLDHVSQEALRMDAVSLRDRAFALSYYFGLAPLAWWRDTGRRSPFLQHHLSAGLALYVLLFGVLVLAVAAVVLITLVLLYWRAAYETVHFEARTLTMVRRVFLAWCVVWAYAAVHAPLGSVAPVPLVWRIAERRNWLRAVAALACVTYGVAALAAALSWDGARLLRADAAPAKVYLLYEDANLFPRWMFTLGFYRLARTAREVYGPNEAVAVKLTEDSLRRALAEGEFVFIGSHGTHEGILLPQGMFSPEEARMAPARPKLRFVYLTGCDQPSDWVEAFAPAEVVTYGRMTAVVEHVWWMWFTGPAKMRTIAGQGSDA